MEFDLGREVYCLDGYMFNEGGNTDRMHEKIYGNNIVNLVDVQVQACTMDYYMWNPSTLS